MAHRPLFAGLAGLSLAGLAGLAGLAMVAGPATAAAPAGGADSADAPLNEVRALNLARNEAIRINGGLTVYRPAKCMFTTSAPTNPCLIRSDAKGFVYRFRGGVPGWETNRIAPSTETELRISTDGRSLVKVIYNGVPR